MELVIHSRSYGKTAKMQDAIEEALKQGKKVCFVTTKGGIRICQVKD